MTTVDLYLRLSIDREGKDSLERQEKDLRAWAKREGLTVRKVWRDAGKSGYKKGVIREDFNKAISAVTKGEVATLAVWKLDRLSRRGAGQVGLVLDLVEEAGGRLFFLRDSLDSTVPGHRMVIVMVSEQARAESANTSLRVSAKIASDARQGVPKKGVRSFGWENDGITIRPWEADLIRQAVADYLSGERSMLRIAADWTEAGVLTDGMKRSKRGRDGVVRPARQVWTATTVRQLLLRERNAGILIHQGVPMPKSQIQAIITEAELDEMKARVKVGTPVGARAASLLGGILRCACGQAMHGTVSYSQRKGGPRNTYKVYSCSAKLYDKTQRHVTIQQSIADEYFITTVISDLYKRLLEPQKSTGKGSELQAVSRLLSANSEALDHLDTVLLDATMKRAHPKAKAQMLVLEAERAELLSRREAVLAETQDSGALEAVLEEMRANAHFDGEGGLQGWADRLSEAWNELPNEVKQAWIKSRYRPTIKVGGRGIDRIVPNPIEG